MAPKRKITDDDDDKENLPNEAKKGKKAPKPGVPDLEESFKAIIEDLAKITKVGDYSIDGDAFELPNLPGLEVAGLGTISLPLVDPQASELIKVCRQTILDNRDVRDSFELDISKIRIKNPIWEGRLNQLVNRIAYELGCSAEKRSWPLPIQANLQKVLVCQKGAHFIKHQDTEQDNKIFGTLIIQPPSSHTGGEMVVHDYLENGKNHKLIDFGLKEGERKYQTHFAAHYPDLEHELLEVTSGYRLALVYSLCWTDDQRQKKIAESLGKINSYSYQLGFLLEHQYTAENLREKGFKALKGADNARLSMLKMANQLLPNENQVALYLCMASLTVNEIDKSGYFNPEGYVIPNYDFEWRRNGKHLSNEYFDENGQSFGKSSHNSTKTKLFDLEDQIQITIMREHEWGVKRDEFIDYSIGQPATRKTEYNNCFLIIWPKKFDFEIIIDNDLEFAINSVYQSILNTTSPFENELTNKFDTIISFLNRHWKIRLEKGLMDKLFEIFRRLGDLKKLSAFLSKQKLDFVFNHGVEIVKLILQFGHGPLKPALDKLIQPNPQEIIKICEFIMLLRAENQENAVEDIFDNVLFPMYRDPAQRELVLDALGKNDEGSIRSRELIKELFEAKIRCLEEFLSQKPTFSWAFPNATMSEHPNVEEFLKSERKEMTEKFNDIRCLRSFIKKYNDPYACKENTGYSAEIIEKPNKNALITKTKNLFEKQVVGYNKSSKQLDEIKSFGF